MSYRWNVEESATANVRRVAMEQVDEALTAVGSKAPVAERIHEVRKRGKRIRALLRLVRPSLGKAYAAENAAVRDATRPLAPIRDARSMVDAYHGLMDRFRDEVDVRRFTPLRQRLDLHREGLELDGAIPRLQRAADEFASVGHRVANWEIADEAPEVWRGGLGRTYRRARARIRVGHRARPAPPAGLRAPAARQGRDSMTTRSRITGS